MDKKPARILIDCSYVDFAKQPTGIPRVVLKYIEQGYEWGQTAGVEVIPVVPTDSGIFICRPVPGRKPPPKLVKAAISRPESPLTEMSASGLRTVCSYLCAVIEQALRLVEAILPIPPVRGFVRMACIYAQRLRDRGVHLAQAWRRSGYEIQPRPGDILFCPAYWHDVPPGIYRRIKQDGAQIIVLVHDLLPIVFDRFYNAPWCYDFRDHVRDAFTYADAFFCVSDYTRSALVEFGRRERQEVPPVMTAYNGIEPLVDAATRAELETGLENHLGDAQLEAFFKDDAAPLLMVGSIEPKKGHIPTIKCLEVMWQCGYQRPLVIVGRRGWLEQTIVRTIERSPFFGRKLFWLSGISDFDLARLYLRSHALIFSSLGEGFGIPMIEAASFGKPAIVFESPIAREVLGDAALFFDRTTGLIDRLHELEDSATYQAASTRASAVSWPTWNDYTPLVFDQMVQVATNPIKLPGKVQFDKAVVPQEPALHG